MTRIKKIIMLVPIIVINKPKGLKVAKEVLMLIGLMVDRLDGR